MFLDKIMEFKDVNCYDGNKKERIIGMVCVNMSGIDKFFLCLLVEY